MTAADVRWHEYMPWRNPNTAPAIPTGCGGCGLAEADHPYLAWSQTKECVEALLAQLDEAQSLLREVSVANNDGEGGHEDLWDAVDAYVATIDKEAGT